MENNFVNEANELMNKHISNFQENIKKVRTGRANPNMLDKIMVDYYGSPTPINQIASIVVQEGKTIMIKPFDRNAVKDIEKAINESDLGLPPQNGGDVIRVTVPSLTEETRKGYCKDVDKMAEEAKVQVRNVRRDINDKIKKDKTIPEDMSKSYLDDIQKTTDKVIENIDKISDDKKKEIMTI